MGYCSTAFYPGITDYPISGLKHISNKMRVPDVLMPHASNVL